MIKTKLHAHAPRIISTLILTAILTASLSAGASEPLPPSAYGSGALTPAVPLSQTYTVGLNKTEIVRLPTPASAILVGNPAIADVSIHSSDTIFVIGRSYGETNILILDTAGNTVLDADIQVNNVLPRNGVRVFYGSNDRETYNCTPYCAAAPVLGDTPGFIGQNSGVGGDIDNTIALGTTGTNSGATGGDLSGDVGDTVFTELQ